MKISPILYNDLFIRYDCLLGFTDSLDLIEVDEVKAKIEKFHRIDNFLQKEHKFLMVYSDKIREKVLDNFTLTDYPALKECVYLSNENMLVEKRLGVNEDIAIRNNSLIAFERTVSFHKIGSNPKYKLINKTDFFIIEGPGLIIFELNHQSNKKLEAIKHFKSYGLIAIILLIIVYASFLFEDFKTSNY